MSFNQRKKNFGRVNIGVLLGLLIVSISLKEPFVYADVLTQATATAAPTQPPCIAPPTSATLVGSADVAKVLTEYTIPTANSTPFGIALGSDGALWFGEGRGKNIARIATDGKFTEYSLPGASIDDQHFLGAGPDGAMWFTETNANKIGFITMDGKITEYTVPTSGSDVKGASGSSYTTSYPAAFSAGPDKAMWFTERWGHKIGRITMDGKITDYPTPTAQSGPLGLVLGPDGALWFTEIQANQIGRITMDGKITEYPVPTPNATLLRITRGPDDALWFTEYRGYKIGRITTDGKITEYDVPCVGPVGIAAGADGAVWFTELDGNRIGRITMDGKITEYPLPTPKSAPFNMVAGPDDAIWFTERDSNKIGRLQVK